MRHPRTRILGCVIAAWLAASPSATAETLTGPALDARVAELGGQVQDIRDQSQQISGTPNPREGKKALEYQVAELRVRQDRLDEAIEKGEGSAEDLAAFRKEYADRSIFTTSDAVGEGVEKVGETVAKKVLSEGAGKVLGWLGIAGDVGEYGGKWVIKQGALGSLDEAVEQNRVNLHDLYQAHIALSGQINDRLRRIDEMKKLIAKDDEIYPEYAKLRERQRLDAEPATKGAVLRRETDAAGDEEERRRYSEEGARRGISTVTQPRIDPKPKMGGPGAQRPGSRY